MAATLIDGKAIATRLNKELANRVAIVTQRLGRPPALAVLLVGDDLASQTYVRNKKRAAEKTGITTEIIALPDSTTEQNLLEQIQRLNNDTTTDAFLIQLPLPSHMDANKVVCTIDSSKDADGLHPLNVGKLMVGITAPRPCTPSGIIKLLDASNTVIKGAHAVVIGRSNIVGKPLGIMLLQRHATVTYCHSRTVNLAEHIKQADIVIAATGVPKLVSAEWLKSSATVIDVGINRVGGQNGSKGFLVGDVDFENAVNKVAKITPVPGGVGPMTIAMLLENTVQAAER